MAENHRGLVTFAWHALLGTLVGALVGGITGVVVEKLLPARFEATVVLFHAPGSGLSDSGRDFVAMTLAQPDFAPRGATDNSWAISVADDVAHRIIVTAADASRPIAEMHLQGTDETTLAARLDAIAEEMVALHRTRQQTALQWQLDALDDMLDVARKRRGELDHAPPDLALLPAATRDAIVAAANLARQRREIELGKRFRLGHVSALDERRRELSLRGLVRQLERAQQALDEHGVAARTQIEQARTIAIADAEILALQQTRDGLSREAESFTPLQIVRPAAVAPLAADASPLLILTALGSLIGLLAGGFAWSWRQSSPSALSAAVIEKSLRIPVLAAIPDKLTSDDYQHALAETRPQGFAVAGVRSLRVALHVYACGTDPATPVVITGIDDPRNASLLIANLAVVAAQAGERVLIIDEVRHDSVLPTMFAPDSTRDAADDARFGTGSIRFVHDDNASAKLPTHTSGEHLDRVFVHVPDTARAREFIKQSGNGVAVLVCASEQPLSALRKAQTNKLLGLVLSGYQIDESAYRGGQESDHAI